MLSGCKSSEAVKQGSDGSSLDCCRLRLRAVPLDPATLGAVSGTMHFAGKAPAPVKIDMSMDPACSMTGGGQLLPSSTW